MKFEYTQKHTEMWFTAIQVPYHGLGSEVHWFLSTDT